MATTTTRPKANRLFCARSAEGRITFCVANGLSAAVKEIGKTARYPMDEEVASFFSANRLHDKSVIEVGRLFGVSAQTVSNWRRRAKVPTATAVKSARRLAAVAATVDPAPAGEVA